MEKNEYQPGAAYDYPLIIKKLLNTPMIYAPDQKIVYRPKMVSHEAQIPQRVRELREVLVLLIDGIVMGLTEIADLLLHHHPPHLPQVQTKRDVF